MLLTFSNLNLFVSAGEAFSFLFLLLLQIFFFFLIKTLSRTRFLLLYFLLSRVSLEDHTLCFFDGFVLASFLRLAWFPAYRSKGYNFHYFSDVQVPNNLFNRLQRPIINYERTTKFLLDFY